MRTVRLIGAILLLVVAASHAATGTNAAARILKEENASLIGLSHHPQTGAQELTRWWQDIEDKATSLCLDYLDDQDFWVTDPEAGWETYEGTWRVVRNTLGKELGRPGGIVQVLQKVYDLTTVAALTDHPVVVSDDQEVLNIFDWGDGDGEKRAYIFKNINPTVAIRDALRVLPAVDLEAAFPGATWKLKDRKWMEEENHTATLLLGFERVTWNAWSNTNAADIIQYSNVQGNRKAERHTWMGIQDADLTNATTDCRLGNGGVAAPSGYYITDVSIADKGYGAFDITQGLKQQLSNSVITASEVIDPHSLCAGNILRTTTTYSGYASTSAVPNPANKVPGTDAGVIRNSLTGPDGDGMYGREIVEETTSWGNWTNETVSSYDFITQDNKDRSGEDRTKVWCAIQSADKDLAKSNLWSAAWTDAGFAVIRVKADDNKNGSIALTQVQVDIQITNAASSKKIDAYSTDYSTTDRNMTNAITHGTNYSQGAIVVTKTAINANGFNDNSYTTNSSTPVAVASRNRAVTAFSDSSGYMAANQTQAIEAVTSVTAGRLTKTSYKLNPDGTYQNSSDTELAITDPAVTISTTLTPFSSNYTVSAVNETNAEDQVTNQTAGVIEKATSTKTAANRYNNQRSIDTAITNVTQSTTYANGVLSDQIVTKTLNTSVQFTNGVEVKNGVLVSRTSTLNDYNLNNNSVDMDTANPDVLISSNRVLGVMSDSYSWTIDNQMYALTPAVEVANGTITEHSSALNRFGRQKNSTSLDIANQNVTNSRSFTITQFSQKGTQTIANQTNEVTSGTAVSSGVITTVKGDLNKYGLNDITTSTNAAIAAPAVKVSKTITPFSISTSTNSINLSTPAAIPGTQTTGEIRSTSHETNQYGLVDVAISVETAETNVVKSRTYIDSQFSEETSITLLNKTNAIADVSFATNGIIVQTRNTLNNFNLNDHTFSTNAVKSNEAKRVTHVVTAFATTTTTNAVNEANPEAQVTNLVPGTIVSTSYDLTDAGRHNNSRSVAVSEQGVDLGTDVDKDLYSTRTVSKTLGATGEVSNSWVASNDYTLATRNSKGEDGLYRTIVASNVFNSVTDANKTTTATAFYSEVRTTDRHQTNDFASAVTNVGANGVLTTQTATKDPTGNYDKTTVVRTPIYVTYTNVVNLTEHGGRTVIRAHNATNLPSPTTVSGTNAGSSVSGGMSPHGLYDWTKTTAWHKDKSDVSGGAFSWTEYRGRYQLKGWYYISPPGDTNYYFYLNPWYHKGYDHTATLYNTREAAWEARDSESHSPVKELMRVGAFGDGLYYYHTMTRGTDALVVLP
jgi:hypothetical protein